MDQATHRCPSRLGGRSAPRSVGMCTRTASASGSRRRSSVNAHAHSAWSGLLIRGNTGVYKRTSGAPPPASLVGMADLEVRHAPALVAEVARHDPESLGVELAGDAA